MRKTKKKLLACCLSMALVLASVGVTDINASAAKKVTLKLNKTSVTLVKGKKTTLKLKTKKNVKKIVKIKWSVKNKKVATVTNAGKVTAKKQGSTVVSAKITYIAKGSKKKVTKTLKCTINVTKKATENTPVPENPEEPSTDPTEAPSEEPGTDPTEAPSTEPSTSPSADPSTSPSADPSTSPSVDPSTSPSADPSTSPSADPSTSPSADPSTSPSADPSTSPSAVPSTSPSADPTVAPLIEKIIYESTEGTTLETWESTPITIAAESMPTSGITADNISDYVLVVNAAPQNITETWGGYVNIQVLLTSNGDINNGSWNAGSSEAGGEFSYTLSSDWLDMLTGGLTIKAQATIIKSVKIKKKSVVLYDTTVDSWGTASIASSALTAAGLTADNMTSYKMKVTYKYIEGADADDTQAIKFVSGWWNNVYAVSDTGTVGEELTLEVKFDSTNAGFVEGADWSEIFEQGLMVQGNNLVISQIEILPIQ